MQTIAVERGLDNVRSFLESQGYQCIALKNEDSQVQGAAVIVISGGDKNMMGMQDTRTEVPVVSAEGLSPDQVHDRIKQILH